MESLDDWRLCEEVTVVQAILLVIGRDPAVFQDYVEGFDLSKRKRPIRYDAVKAAITHAILSEQLPAKFRTRAGESDGDEHCNSLDPMSLCKAEPDWQMTVVAVKDLRTWLIAKSFQSEFFLTEPTSGPRYLDVQDPCYSPKLAAAIGAWEAVRNDRSATKGKSVKRALANWLRKHAKRYRLLKADGKPNEQGIDEVAKIANWDTKGGAPKTL